MRYQIAPLFCRPWTLLGFTPRLIESHYENNYGGAVRRLNVIAEQLAGIDYHTAPNFVINGLKREELIASQELGPCNQLNTTCVQLARQ